MNTTIKIAATEAEREAIYRLRYEVYVEEMQIFGDVADHTRRMLIGPNDADARLMYATRWTGPSIISRASTRSRALSGPLGPRPCVRRA